jgi:hypothetical protein
MQGDENRFARFIADLALQPGKLAHYLEDSEAAMQAAGLNDEEKAVLRTGDFNVICDYLVPTRDRPAPGDWQPGPGGQ